MTTARQRTVAQIDPQTDPRYEAFVADHERATAYHAGAWARILRSAYGFRPAYLALSGEDDTLEGVLPLMYTRGIASGRRMRSLPVLPSAGPLATSAAGEATLLEAACRAADLRGGELTVISRSTGYEGHVAGLRTRERHPSWITPLGDDADALRASWKKSSSNLWRSIRKSETAGVTVREGKSEEDLRVFYAMYLDTMKRHRVLPRAWRQVRLDRLMLGPSGVYRLFIAEHEGRAVAGGLFHAFGDTVDLLYNGSDVSERDLRANFGLYWHAIRWAVENGYRRFDWGEAQDGGSLARFKAQWSAELVPNYNHRYRAGGLAADRPSRADRLRNKHDVIDHQGVQGRRDLIVDRAWEAAPRGVVRVAGGIVYRVF